VTATAPSMSAAAESQVPDTCRNQEDAVAVVASRRSSAPNRPTRTTDAGRSVCTGVDASHGDYLAREATPRVETDKQLAAVDGADQTEEGSQAW
jgi:hypothetical protein